MAKKKPVRIPVPPQLPGPALRSLVHLAENSEAQCREALPSIDLDTQEGRARFDQGLALADGLKRSMQELQAFMQQYELWWCAYLDTVGHKAVKPE